MAAPNQQAQQLALMEPGEAAATAVAVLARATVNTAKAHPKITGSWALGLILVAFATGFKVTEGQHQAYDAGMQAADMSAPIGAAAARLREAEQLRYQARGGVEPRGEAASLPRRASRTPSASSRNFE